MQKSAEHRVTPTMTPVINRPIAAHMSALTYRPSRFVNTNRRANSLATSGSRH